MADTLVVRAHSLAPRQRLVVPVTVVWTLLVFLVAAGLGAILALHPTLIVAGLLGAILLVAILARPDAATPLTLGIIYSNAAVVGAQFHGLPYLFAVMAPALLLLPIAFRLLVQRKPLIVTSALPFIAIYVVVQIASALASGALVEAMDELGLFLTQGMALYLLITNALHSPQLIRVAMWSVILVGTILAGLTVTQQVIGTFEGDFFGFAQVTERGLRLEAAGEGPDYRQPKAIGPVGENNFYAQVLVVLVPLGLFRFWGERSVLLRAAALAATVVIVVGVTLTFSRGAALGLGALVVVLALLRYISIRQLALLGLATLLLAVAMPTYVERLSSLEDVGGATAATGEAPDTDPVFQQRANDVLTALLVFSENPVLGVGPGRFTSVYREHSGRVRGIPGDGDYAAHNLVAEIGAETGLLGLIVFGTILFVTMRDLWRARKLLASTRPDLANVAAAFLMALVVYLGTSIALHLSYQRYFWTLLAMAGATAYVCLREARALHEGRETDIKAQADGAASHSEGIRVASPT